MTIPADYKAEHLFLLVGKNPLPNVVAIDALRSENGTVYLVCTAETRPIARKIINATGLQEGANAHPIQVNDERGAQVTAEVARNAAGKASLGLNYTGGTKHMVLHAFQGIRQAAEASNIQPILSYLDARTLKMRVERLGSLSNSYSVTSIKNLDLASLLEMHGYRVKNYTEAPILPAIYPALAKLKPKELSGWYQKARNGRKKEAQRDIPLPSIPTLTPYWGKAATVGEFADALGVSMAEMGDWFAGHWLEHYTLAAIQQIAPECGIDASVMNLETVDFEFDVAALRGYQLFAMSCNTQAEKGTIKQKLFEAYIRAHQMGGDEARVAVVCFAPKQGDASPKRIEDDVSKAWDVQGKVRVFGEAHLPDLPGHLKHWISQQN